MGDSGDWEMAYGEGGGERERERAGGRETQNFASANESAISVAGFEKNAGSRARVVARLHRPSKTSPWDTHNYTHGRKSPFFIRTGVLSIRYLHYKASRLQG